ncbi:hypothetical protein BJ508DRAFT_348116 [Ascobolus immersus RN42]|uniref:Uncharacterized protein n=1 Tax=Ascobolus immersus RN42 TaxID=1160509 RepID=A0A3N4I081_ASCIM|nr:hypothetical protein BJ508DRAFT_348116 [Ascobolus immersus RN42]
MSHPGRGSSVSRYEPQSSSSGSSRGRYPIPPSAAGSGSGSGRGGYPPIPPPGTVRGGHPSRSQSRAPSGGPEGYAQIPSRRGGYPSSDARSTSSGSSDRDRYQRSEGSYPSSVSEYEAAPPSRPPSSRPPLTEYELSVQLYGLGTVQPAHWGLVIGESGPNVNHGELHHAVKDRTDNDFEYEKKTGYYNSAQAQGRSIVASKWDCDTRDRSAAILSTVKPPMPPNENCQNWVTNGLGRLEKERYVPEGTESYWRTQMDQTSAAVAGNLRRDGRSWIENKDALSRRPPPTAPADARFGAGQTAPRRPPGKLAANPEFLARMQNLSGPRRN